MFRQALMALSQQRRLQHLAMHNPVARSMAARFVAGQSLDEAIEVVRSINARGMSATLDHLGENVHSREEAKKASAEYCQMLYRIAQSGVDSNVSLKLTQMGLDVDRAVAMENVSRVVDEAKRHGNFVRIDMEGSPYVEATLDLFMDLHATYKNVGVVIQSYLYRSHADIERLNAVGARVRLVKGAYLEPPAVAYQNKPDVDWNFVRLMEILLAYGEYPAVATHDPAMIAATRDFAALRGIASDRFEFQMLYGIRRDLQVRLVEEGYRMRVYVPFGTEWYPYLMRRLAERPANLVFVAGNLVRETRSRRSSS